MMKDYNIQIKIRNNWLLTAMRRKGVKNASQLAKISGCSSTEVGYIMNLKTTPYNKRGVVRQVVSRVAEFLEVLPENLFPPHHRITPLERNVAELEFNREQVEMIASGPSAQHMIEHREDLDVINQAVSHLSEREQRVIKMRYDDHMTLDEISKEFKVSKERTRQIEKKALRRLSNNPDMKQFKQIKRSTCVKCNRVIRELECWNCGHTHSEHVFNRRSKKLQKAE